MVDKKQHGYQQLSQAEHDAPPTYDDAVSLVARTGGMVVSQPLATPQMSIAGARNPKGQPVGFDGQRDWNHGLCDCLERPGLTVGACCCPCMVYNHNRTRLTHLYQSGQPAPSPSYCGLSCLLYALAPQVAGIGQMALQCMARFQTRNRYALRGNAVEDVLVGAFCAPCSLVQESREIEDEEQALRAGVLGADVPPPAVEGAYRDEVGDEERAVGN
ncbi:PLAC8 family-domain containing protein [Rhodotorula toruloides]|uniref:PLAC8 family-domain containing protein n=1 Tax=Rhodotorula toruloides TaxID=5286 RepID=A0A0K3CHS1_RHOTO|nr:PLAC8 family-domain containing protein [Rhodotorula toruloides]PRQ73174.1 PLAC8 family-domain containing protein [Rhodotorula toruloides]